MNKQQNIRFSEIAQALTWAVKGQLSLQVAYRLACLAGYEGEYSEFLHQVNADRQGATTSHTDTPDPRIDELLALAEVEGITLPLPPALIVAMENLGAVVDLRTGAIVVGEADRAYTWELTEKGRDLARGCADV